MKPNKLGQKPKKKLKKHVQMQRYTFTHGEKTPDKAWDKVPPKMPSMCWPRPRCPVRLCWRKLIALG